MMLKPQNHIIVELLPVLALGIKISMRKPIYFLKVFDIWHVKLKPTHILRHRELVLSPDIDRDGH